MLYHIGHCGQAWPFLVCDNIEVVGFARCVCAGKPLFGIPFAAKDNIDVAAGRPTRCVCPTFPRVADGPAACVAAVIAAGAVCVGSTSMDQFATGLIGTRSPRGAVRNTLKQEYVVLTASHPRMSHCSCVCMQVCVWRLIVWLSFCGRARYRALLLRNRHRWLRPRPCRSGVTPNTLTLFLTHTRRAHVTCRLAYSVSPER